MRVVMTILNCSFPHPWFFFHWLDSDHFFLSQSTMSQHDPFYHSNLRKQNFPDLIFKTLSCNYLKLSRMFIVNTKDEDLILSTNSFNAFIKFYLENCLCRRVECVWPVFTNSEKRDCWLTWLKCANERLGLHKVPLALKCFVTIYYY